MHPFHVIEQVPSSWESIVFGRAITVLEDAQVGFLSMAMHSVGFPFMSQETSSR